MPDTFTVTTNASWFSRIGKAIVGVFIGLIMVLVAFPLIWWNEGRAVHRLRSLEEGARVVVDVPADSLSAANDGKLVHLTGLASTDETLADPDFGISAPAIRLERIAETYQWKEESSTHKRKKFGGGEETTTTYTYKKTWARQHIDSGDFHERGGHENPAALEWEPRTVMAGHVTCGAFTLPSDVVDKIGGATARDGDESDVEKMRARGFVPTDAGAFYKGRNPSDPQIGDVRVRFETISPQTVSIVAAQQGSSLASYHARAGSDILLVERGTVAAEQMFKEALTSNKMLTWALRAGGLLVMFIGFVLVFRPLSVVGSVVPAIGSVVGAGTGFLSFLLALALSLTTMALAWLAYRPLLGGSLLLAAAGAVVLLVRTRRPKRVVPPPIPVG